MRNPVVLTGDVHAHWASELKLDYDDPTTSSVGTRAGLLIHHFRRQWRGLARDSTRGSAGIRT